MNRTCAPVLSGFSGPFSRVKKTKLTSVPRLCKLNLRTALYGKYITNSIFGIGPVTKKVLSYFSDHDGDHGYFDESKFSLMYYADEMCNDTIRTKVGSNLYRYTYLNLHFFHTRRG